jgi:hypothetical protein
MRTFFEFTSATALIALIAGVAYATGKTHATTPDTSSAKHWLQVGQQQGIYCGAMVMESPCDCDTDSDCQTKFISKAQACLDQDTK